MFPSKIYKFKIDPSTYEKNNVIQTMLENYKINPQRNAWDNHSKLHHAYEDWNNDQYQKVDISSLIPPYQKVVDAVMGEVSFNKPVPYTWFLVNIAINTKFMNIHDHMYKTNNSQSLFSCVHYIKFNKTTHSSTTFLNPLPIAYFEDNVNRVNTFLNSDEPENSSYFSSWNLEVEEDDFVVFPSYLKHIVYDNKTQATDDRIVSVSNIELIIN